MRLIVGIKFWLLWMVLGLVVIITAVITHLVKAERSGYDALIWHYNNRHVLRDSLGGPASTSGAFIVGLTLWPYRLMQFMNSLPDLYNEYETKF